MTQDIPQHREGCQQGKERLSSTGLFMQLMAVIENVMPKFITVEEVDGFLFHGLDLDRKAADGEKERVRIAPVSSLLWFGLSMTHGGLCGLHKEPQGTGERVTALGILRLQSRIFCVSCSAEATRVQVEGRVSGRCSYQVGTWGEMFY